MHKGCDHHLDQHALAAAVVHGHQRIDTVHQEGLVTDQVQIVIIVQIDDANRIDPAHTSPPMIRFSLL